MYDLLIICNLQNDYLEGGSYATKGSLDLVLVVNRIKKKFKHVIFVNDKHPPDHISFKGHGGNRPSHCVEGTVGCELNPEINIKESDHIITKGYLTLYDSDSAFYVATEINKETTLKSILDDLKITDIYICGLKYEQDVFVTAIDALKFRYNTYFVEDATLGDDDDKIKKCKDILINSDVKFVCLDT